MYNYGEKYTIDDKIYQNVTYKIYPYTAISESTEGYALQNKKALGVTGEKGNANYPINAVMILISGYNLQREYVDALNEKINILDNYETGYTDIEFKDNTYIKKYLDDYSIKLNNMGYEVSNTNIMSIKELNDLIYNISKRNLPLSDWYNASQNTSFSEEEIRYGTLGDLKDYLSNDYSWIWNTTYWMRTLKGNITESMEYFPEGYFG